MIVIDTSALMAILLEEPSAEACETAIEVAAKLLISAGTLTEAMSGGVAAISWIA